MSFLKTKESRPQTTTIFTDALETTKSKKIRSQVKLKELKKREVKLTGTEVGGWADLRKSSKERKRKAGQENQKLESQQVYHI